MDTAYEFVEGGYDALGLMRGDSAPMKRGLFTGGVAYAIIYATKPSFAFNMDGSPRPWSAVSSDPNATSMPHWLAATVPAFISAFMI